MQCDVKPPRLVAVSKTHGVERVSWAYQQGLRHFGENYVSKRDVNENLVILYSRSKSCMTSPMHSRSVDSVWWNCSDWCLL